MPEDGAASGRPAAGRTRRVAPLGTRSAAMQPGHSRAAHPASRRAEPAAGERAGGRRKIRTGAAERGGDGAGRERRGRAALRTGATPGTGDPFGQRLRLPQGGAGGQRRESGTRSGLLFRIRHRPNPPVGAQVAREGPRAAATPAQRQPAESSPTLECPGQVPLQSRLTPLPPGCAPRSSARRRTELARGLDGGLQEGSGGAQRGWQERPGPQCRSP
ncbi:uncharacterized protein LOC113835035 [Cricetulus griseus]|uniref:Uncharacterized protein LOC113835035 n=1 Tax=Cricetulus griseus TaxID=10029 RepID=A0A9J7JKS5_CRIGR|nr:uncharacterized protein LOC113835035 [Cricetulus griseus]